MTIQQAIENYVSKKGIKQTVIAEKCGWSKQKASGILSGKQRLLAVDHGKLCEALEVPYDFFYNQARGKSA